MDRVSILSPMEAPGSNRRRRKIDVPVELGMERVSGRGEADRFEVESIRFFERVRKAYLDRAAKNPQRFSIIDASQDEEQIWQQVERVLQTRPGL